MRTKTNLLIASMAVSDILAGVAIFGQWIFCAEYMLLYGTGDYPCAIFKSLQIVTYFLSTLTMVTIGIHRYIGIFHRHLIRFNVTAAIVVTWLIAIVVVAMTAVSVKIFKYFTSKEIISCGVVLEFTEPFDSKKVRKVRVAVVLLTQFLLPLILMTLIYGRIMYFVLKRQVIGEQSQQRSKQLSNSKRNTIMMLVTVVIVFTVCWLPVHFLHLLNFFVTPNPRLKNYCNNSTSYFLVYWFSISSCCYNPIIYYIFDPKFRNGFQKVFNLLLKIKTSVFPGFS
ncbi:putative G-protein coupled receptor 83-like protein [Dinothrombium tinctorium]|uniref:Putative G-protein coupled receptor 83-like protein n=1 Tax=Dinothrombium tinctorium TaxID=1965070 RepID=A0A3S3PKQ6_9ACAR|nr:putative G-protein coupled receptor 83-like protein [Dinothrombium tinctorium]